LCSLSTVLPNRGKRLCCLKTSGCNASIFLHRRRAARASAGSPYPAVAIPRKHVGSQPSASVTTVCNQVRNPSYQNSIPSRFGGSPPATIFTSFRPRLYRTIVSGIDWNTLFRKSARRIQQSAKKVRHRSQVVNRIRPCNRAPLASVRCARRKSQTRSR